MLFICRARGSMSAWSSVAVFVLAVAGPRRIRRCAGFRGQRYVWSGGVLRRRGRAPGSRTGGRPRCRRSRVRRISRSVADGVTGSRYVRVLHAEDGFVKLVYVARRSHPDRSAWTPEAPFLRGLTRHASRLGAVRSDLPLGCGEEVRPTPVGDR